MNILRKISKWQSHQLRSQLESSAWDTIPVGVGFLVVSYSAIEQITFG